MNQMPTKQIPKKVVKKCWISSKYQSGLFRMTLRLPAGGNTSFSCHFSSAFSSSKAMFSFLLQWHAKHSSLHSLPPNTLPHSPPYCPKFSPNILDCLSNSIYSTTSTAPETGFIKTKAMPVAQQRCFTITGSGELKYASRKWFKKVPQSTVIASCWEGLRSAQVYEQKTVRLQGSTSS